MSENTDPERDSALETLFYQTDRVRFVNWREFSGSKPTVVLTGAITVVSFITGLSNISQGVMLEGVLAPVLPAAELYARFAGVLFAFLLGITTIGLQRRKRIAWYVAVAVLLLLSLLPLATFQTTDIPLLLLVALTVPLLIRNRGQFDQPLDLSPLQLASILSVGGVVVYGTVGSYGLRDQFTGELLTWTDAFYFVIVTIATVGYGDFTPTTPEAKVFSLTVILFGTGAFTVAVGSLIVPAIESRMAAAFGTMTASELNLLEDHVLVLGYGDITESLLDELVDETDVVVVTDDESVASELDDKGVSVLTDDPADEDALGDARIDAASGVVVATRDDAKDVLTVLAAKNAAPDIRVVAAANRPKHVGKLEQVGADEVISPMTIGGRLLSRSVLGGTTTEELFESVGDGGPTPGNGEEAASEDGGTGDVEE
ncbi:MAG: NAD-binding protein [Halolamina sp.]|uniref:NAD-binding protein n=1 Tax=Halolamina sp. TaxID=1940283 RepID=UPI002FC34214